MEVELTQDQEALVLSALESGRLLRPEDAVREALALWEERERRRAELVADIAEAEASLARGEGFEVDASGLRDVFDAVSARGRSRFSGGRARD